MTLYEYNLQIRKLNIEDPTNERIYTLLHDLILEMLTLKRYKISLNDKEDVAYTLAGDIWMKIINGSYFKFVNNYIDRVLLRYVLEHLGKYRAVEVFDIVEYQQLVDTFIAEDSEVCFGDAENEAYLTDIDVIIDQLMKVCPYYKDTPKYLNFKLSLVTSLYLKKPYLYKLNEFDSEKIRMFIINFYEKVRKDLI